MFKLVILGSGGSIPTPSRNTTSIGVKVKGDVYAFDACEGMQKQMMKFKLSFFKTKAIFITHLHPDHYLGIPGLIYTLQLSNYNSKLEIIGPKGTEKLIRNLLNNKIP